MRRAPSPAGGLTSSGEAALVDPRRGSESKREDSAKSAQRCEFKAKAQARIKAKIKSEAKAAAEPKQEVELDVWGFPILTATPDTSRQRNRKRKIAAAKALYGLKPGNSDEGRGRSFTVCICGKFSRNDVGGDLVLEATASSKTSLINAQFCGSSWTCADCAMHICVTRGSYVERAIDALRGAGYRVVMTTMTVPHQLVESCAVVFDRLKRAHAKLDAHGSYRNLRDERGYIGRFRSIEITFGESGWHVHSHDIEVYQGEGQTTAKQDNDWCAQLQDDVYRLWNKIIFRLTGKQASKSHGFTVVPVWSATDYPVKLPEQAEKRQESGKARWGAQAEITKSYMKKAERGGRTPWDILDGCYAGNQDDIDLFRDYARGTWNRTQFEVTKGLRELLESLDVAPLGSELEIIREEPDFIFTDELHENDGDQSNLVVDRVLIDPAHQLAAHKANPRWLESVRHDVELDLAMDLPHAMRAAGFELVLVEELRFVGARTDINAPPGVNAIEAGHFEPNVWRASWRETSP